MRLYPDIIIIILTVIVLYMFYQSLCGASVENFISSGIKSEDLQNIVAVVDQNFLTMPYMIVMYKGAANAIPDGWALCDGRNGTPDLRDKFVVCAGSRKRLNSTGGGSVRLTTANLPAHTHAVRGNTSTTGKHRHNSPGGKCADTDSGKRGRLATGDNKNNDRCDASEIMNNAGDHAHSINFTSGSTGSGSPFTVEPAYYALSFIMKLPPA